MLPGCIPAIGSNLDVRRSPPPTAASVAAVLVRELIPMVGTGPGNDDGASPRGKLRAPNGVEIDATGNLYLADTGNHRIRKITRDGRISTVAGSDSGFVDGAAGQARFHSPFGLAIKRDGTIYVADTKNHCIRAISQAGDITTVAGNGTPGFVDGEGAAARFDTPFAVALDALDHLIVADAGNHRVRRVALELGKTIVTTIAGGGAGYTDGDLVESRFSAPSDVALDMHGRIYVADLRNNAIRIIDLSRATVRTLAGGGEAGFEDGEGPAAHFRSPAGLTVDAEGALYIADSQNRAIRKIAPDGSVTTVARLSDAAAVPTDVAVSQSDALYVVDSASHQILRTQ